MTFIQNETTIKRVYLYGSMADKFSKEPIELAVNSIEELNLAFRSIFKEWRAHLSQNPGVTFILSDDGRSNPRPILSEFVDMKFGSATEVHLFHELDGEWAAAIAVIAKYVTTQMVINMLVSFAVSTVLGMISQALAPSPNTGSGSRNVARNESFIYNGAINTMNQGGPVPIIYGYFMTGSTVVSTSIDVEQLLVTPAKSAPPANGGGQVQPQFPPAVPWQWAGK